MHDEPVGDMTAELERRSARFVVWFVVVSMVPSFLGFVVGVSTNSPVLVIVIGCVAIAVAMMWVVRKRRRARENGEPRLVDEATTPLHVVVLAVVGIAASVVTAALQLGDAGEAWARLIVGTLGAGILLLAGWLALRHQTTA